MYLHMYKLTTFYLTLYLSVALLISFLELPFGGPELGVNLAVVIVVLGRVICVIIIIVIILVLLFLFLFLPLHYIEPFPDSACLSSFILDQLLSSASC